jgi:hypothetical protein
MLVSASRPVPDVRRVYVCYLVTFVKEYDWALLTPLGVFNVTNLRWRASHCSVQVLCMARALVKVQWRYG